MKKYRKFIDRLRLVVKGGNGGMGHPKFGGVGGKGGDVYVCGVKDQTMKKTLRIAEDRRWSGGPGGNSRKVRILGEPGHQKNIPVPVGTCVKLDQNKIIGDINQVGEKVLVATGGAGGSPHNQFNGQKGQARNITLELKLLADVGLVGFPNAGKSTFLRAISRAKPKIASYPFTTIEPNIGMVEYSDKRQISLADLPGLIEGAWANVGMGHRFLRHVERTSLLLFVVDINGFRLSPMYPHRSAFENLVLLNKELELYNADLVDKPALLVVNKMDCENSEERWAKLLESYENLPELIKNFPEEVQPDKLIRFDDIIPCSARMNPESVDHVKERVRQLLDVYADQDTKQIDRELSAYQQVKDKLVEKSKRMI